MIEAEGEGVLLYLAQEGRGIGLLNKLRAYKLQEEGLDTVEANERLGLPADLRDFGIGAQILVDLGLSSIRILTNNPKKIHALEGYGLSVTDQIPIEEPPNPENLAYLRDQAREARPHRCTTRASTSTREMLRGERGRQRRRADGPLRDRRRALLRGPRGAARARRARGASRPSRTAQVEVFDVPGAFELPAAALYAAQTRPLPRRRLPRRGDPRRDRPLRPRLRRGGARDPGGRRCAPASRAASACSPSTATSRRSRAPAAASATPAPTPPHAVLALAAIREPPRDAARLPCDGQGLSLLRARARRSATRAATRWSRPAGASTRTCRRSGSSTTARPRRVYVCTRCLKAGKVTKARVARRPGRG